MKKILIVFNHPAPYKVALFNGLADFFDLHVIFERDRASNRNKIFYQTPKYKFTTHKIRGIKIGKENIISSGIVHHLKKNKYDLIVMNGYSTFAEMQAINYLKRHKIPYLFYINGGVVRNESKLKAKIKKHFILGAEHYLSPAYEADKYLLHYGVEKAKIFHYPYSTIHEADIVKNRLNHDEKMFKRKALGLDQKTLFVSVGQFIDRKNNLELLKIWRDQPADRDLLIIGEGPERPLYEKYISDHHLKNVKLLDFMPKQKLLATIRLADYGIFLSKEDIYGHVVNEAMSQGLGVISSDRILSGCTLVKNGKNGFLVNIKNEPQIVDAIDKIVKIDCFEQARLSAHQNTIEKMVAAHVAFFRGLK